MSDSKLELEILPREHRQSQFLVVGLGASAGGIQALREFFDHVPADSGIAYVVILHLSPEHESKLAEILQVTAEIPVTQVTEKITVEPDHVYVVPQNQHLKMIDGAIVVSPNTLPEERRAPVDIFFRTLAESHGARAVAVVLSGTGANGSMGLKRIKEKGGAAFVQEMREAEFNEMPRNSIATGLVDEVLPVAKIPGRIISYQESLRKVGIPVEVERHPEDQQQALREVFTQLRLRTGHDFSSYKRQTVLRRINHRIHIRQLPDLLTYAAFIRQNPAEAEALFKELLISVTNFFRDPRAYEAIEQLILPRILEGKKATSQVRIWVVGCATGEEAYSMAMLIAERTFGMIDAPKVQIFATDIDEAALAVAREGRYTINDAADVSPERLSRFFTKVGDHYRVNREIREMVLFVYHDIIKDLPLTHLDLVSCRNLLIYLKPAAQERVMETFHFALNPGGTLFLGLTETIDDTGNLFAPVSEESRIFKSRETEMRRFPLPDLTPILKPERPPSVISPHDQERNAFEQIPYSGLHQQLLEQYAPPSVVINADFDIVHLSEHVGKYLKISGGAPTMNLLKVVNADLRPELQAGLNQAVRQKANVVAKDLEVQFEGRIETLNIHIRPVLQPQDPAHGLILVLFEMTGEAEGRNEEVIIPTDPVARHLEEALARMKTRLRRSIEQYEVQAEELKSSNEELQAMNEEQRAATEELVTSKEELQAINEELRTVNEELKAKIEETTLASNNLNNFINSSDIGTIFLDRNFRVQLYTPAARGIFNLIPADTDRPLTDITNRLAYNGLVDDVQAVLDDLQVVEREVRAVDERIYLMRVMPYRTTDDHILGVIVSFVDITGRKRAEVALRESEERLRVLVESVHDYAIFTIDREGHVTSWNEGARRITGYSAEEIIGQPVTRFYTPKDVVVGKHRREMEAALAAGRSEDESWRVRKDESLYWCNEIMTPLRADDGGLLGYTKISRDLTERRRVEERIRASEERLRLVVESVEDYAIFTINTQGQVESWNTGAERIFGYSVSEMAGQSVEIIFTPEDRKQELAEVEMRQAREAGRAGDERWYLNKSGVRIYVSGVMTPLRTGNGLLAGYVKIARDLTERKRLEDALLRVHNELEERVRERTVKLAETNTSLESEVRERRAAEDRVKSLLKQLVKVQEEERRRLSRELHDSFGQQLTALRLGIDAITKSGARRMSRQGNDLRAIIKQLDRDVDFLAHELRPAALDELGLVSALANFTSEWSKVFGIPADFHSARLTDERLTSEIETNLYRITQEALNNVAKHAQATHVAVVLERRDGHITLIIEDNGIGMTLGEDALTYIENGGLGLIGMRERAALIGGELEIESSAGDGTTIFVRLPIRFQESIN
jgi:two-component system CheB/CheR fusion protein